MKITVSIVCISLSLYAIFGCTKQPQPLPQTKSAKVIEAEKALFSAIENKKKDVEGAKLKSQTKQRAASAKPKQARTVEEKPNTLNYSVIRICGIP